MSLYNMSALVLLILATQVAAFNELPPRVEVDNDTNSWHSDVEDNIEADIYWRRSLLLYKLLKLLQGGGDRYDAENNLKIEQNLSESPDFKEVNEKKWLTLLSFNLGRGNKTPKSQPQPKWKLRKGIPGLCYLKLCSFRYPV